jgi:uncharacterized protein YndB with AHSA1/START domain
MSRFQVERAIEIHAQPDRVFAVVADYHTWTTWSPWLCAEPDAKVTVTGGGSSVGSVYAWTGEATGQGELEHKRLEPGQLIEDEIRFLKPFKSKSRVAFELIPQGEGTRLTWSMDGSLPASNALRVEHVGSYEHLGNAWSAAKQIARYRKLKQCKVGTFEIYRNPPPETPESELRTDVYLPLRS